MNKFGKYIGAIEDSIFRKINIYESVGGGRIYTMFEFDVEYVVWDTIIVERASLQTCLDYESVFEKREKR